MRFTLLFILITFTYTATWSQDGCFGAKAEQAFGAGEEIRYTVNYSAAIISANVAEISMITTLERLNQTMCYKIAASGKTRPFYNMFFEIDDKYTTWVDTATMRSLRATSDLKEGGYLYKTDFNFNWKAKTVHTLGHNIKRNATYRKLMPIGNCSFDALGLFYNMRSMDTEGIAPGKQYKLSLVLEDTVRTITLRYVGKDIRSLDKIGKFRTLKFACRFATSNDESFKDGDEFFIWISDDKNKIPIYLESPIKVGKISAVLSSWSNLRHPFSSIIIPKP